ncbi:MAG: multiple sugar transport system permease protein [Thermomicrobiales bacterium]|nr:multiple sugar transport system permease protein [Thermomicrobiales bacterium]
MAAVTHAVPGGARRRTAQRIVGRTLLYLLAISGSAILLLPQIWMLRSSLMDINQIFIYPPTWIPKPWQFQNYPDVFDTVPFLRYFQNTLTILIPSVIGTVVTSSLAAYGFSRLRWPGRDLVFGILMTTLMLPYAVTLIPTFLVWSKLGLVNTFWPLIVPSWFGGHIFFIFLLRQFFRGIPRDLDEAALIDGANPLRILWDIVLPLSRPALISVVIFSSLSTWNDFLHPLIYLNDDRKFTLALGLAQFRGLYNSEWHLLMAASMLVVAPVLLLFVVAQRYFVEGIALTGIKG